MSTLEKIFLFRMTHIKNIPHVLSYGITHISSPNRNTEFIPIGDGSLIETRSFFTLPNGNRLGNYIPFYFGPRMPMLYVIQHGFNGVTPVAAADIVYCITTVSTIIKFKVDYLFSNGHAIDGFSEFYGPNDINDIDTIVDFSAVNKKYWNKEGDLDLKRRKEAEFLVLGDIPPEAVLGFAVYNDSCVQILQQMPNIANKKIVVKPNYYF
jgi:hypothetical protein